MLGRTERGLGKGYGDGGARRELPGRLVQSCQQNPVRGASTSILRKEVIQPQVPLRLPCYDFTPVIDPTVDGCLLAVSAPA